MIKKPKISVIMAVYNSERYLAEAIDSILNQTFRNFELIIVNDKSTDNSLRIIKGYMKKDNRVKLINNKMNLGAAETRNRGLKNAKGDYIAIMDSDDISLPKRLEIQCLFLENRPDIFLVGGSWININHNGVENYKSIYNLDYKKVQKIMPNFCPFHHPAIMFRNNNSIRYRIKLVQAEDTDLYLRLLSRGERLEVIPDMVIKYRINENSMASKNAFEQRFFGEKVKKFYFQRIENGADNYKHTNFQEELKKFDVREIKKYNLKIQLLIYFKQNFGGGKKFRKELYNYLELYGLFSWVSSPLYYLFSFVPRGITRAILKIIKFIENIKNNI